MDRLPPIVGLLIMAIACTGCATVLKKGDVDFVMQKASGWRPFSVDGSGLRFPAISIGHVHSETFRVRSLPVSIAPQWGYVEVPEDEDTTLRRDQPWRSAVLRVIVRATDGAVLHDEEVRFKDWNGSSQPGSSGRKRQLSFLLTPWHVRSWSSPRPDLKSYDVTFEVVEASGRSSDRMTIIAPGPYPTEEELRESNKLVEATPVEPAGS
ncbi:MAG: hypothetical protein KJT03_19595 [Verrucomicrobiae bacterium]|nr:hypothetical protein [Verrucomicrobiae bacterium]